MESNQENTKDCLICLSSADTARALGLLEEYCTKLRKPEEQQLKTAIQRVLGIFQSNLFEALLGKSVKHDLNIKQLKFLGRLQKNQRFSISSFFCDLA